MGDPAPNDGEIPPVQAAQLPAADAENHAPAIVAQPAMAVQAVSVANYQVPSLEKFSFKPEDWTRWIRRFERFRKATGLDQKSGESQVNTLVYSMGEAADYIMISFGLTADDAKQYEQVKNRFESHFIVKRNIIFERAKFNLRSQQEGESVETFITDLHCLAEHCEFGVLKDELIRDRIVVGLKDKKLSEKLQLDSKLTLEKAVTQARQSETVKKQQDILQGTQPDPPSANVDQILKKRGKGGKGKDQKDKPPKNSKLAGKTPETKCTRCLGTPHSKQECPAKDSKCNKCFKKGHWAKASKSQLKKKVEEVYSCPEVELEGEFFLGQLTEVDMVEGNSKESWKAEVKLNEHAVKFKVDTGADVTVIPPITYHSLVPKPSLSKCDKTLMGPCKHKLCCLGSFRAKLCVDDKVVRELIYIVKDLERPLLGRDAAEKLKLVNRVDTVSSDDYKTKMANKYPKLFTGLRQMKDSYTITLKEDAKPFAISVPRKVPLPLYQKTKDELDRMLETGVISPVDQPTDWCAPMVVTPKSNSKVRVCVDLSKLNEFVKRENHPLPAVDTTLGRLAGSTVFTKLDANSGFWQIKLAWESRPLTTFITPWGRFCFNVLPFGISSGSEKFQKTMNQILLGLEGVECNIDDVLVHGKDQHQHDERLEAVLKRLLEAGVTLNLDKCVFSTKQVKFLGHVISSNGIEVDPDKVKAIADLPAPTNVQEVRTFLGMVNQLSKFSDHLADKTKSIRELLLQGNKWTWGNAQQKAFEQIKVDLARAPVLALYDPNTETKVAADVSSYGLGGVVLQLQPDKSWRPVSFLSRALTPTESRYAQIEKEALALTWACERSWEYITGKSIYVEMDHKPLVPLLSTHSLDQLPPRIQRFRMRLMRFHFKEISHVPGKKMYIADALSRLQTQHADPQPTIADDDMTAHIASVITGLPASDTRLQQIIEAQEEDPVCRQIKAYCSEGWPDKHSVNDAMKPYWSTRGELTVVQNILLKETRIVIPSSMRLEILDKIHEGHQGIAKCREQAKSSVWWPGLSREIQDLVQQCRTCALHRDNKPEPLIATPLPDCPWQIVATDLFQMKGIDYLIVIDYYSRYVEVAAMT